MFYNARNDKKIDQVANTLQALVQAGIKPLNIAFNERKPKVTVASDPTLSDHHSNLGPAYCYSWGTDTQGRFYEMYMLPMRELNLVWRTYPQRKAFGAAHQDKYTRNPHTESHIDSKRTNSSAIPQVRSSLRLGTNYLHNTAQECSFGIPA